MLPIQSMRLTRFTIYDSMRVKLSSSTMRAISFSVVSVYNSTFYIETNNELSI